MTTITMPRIDAACPRCEARLGRNYPTEPYSCYRCGYVRHGSESPGIRPRSVDPDWRGINPVRPPDFIKPGRPRTRLLPGFTPVLVWQGSVDWGSGHTINAVVEYQVGRNSPGAIVFARALSIKQTKGKSFAPNNTKARSRVCHAFLAEMGMRLELKSEVVRA